MPLWAMVFLILLVVIFAAALLWAIGLSLERKRARRDGARRAGRAGKGGKKRSYVGMADTPELLGAPGSGDAPGSVPRDAGSLDGSAVDGLVMLNA